MKITVLSIDLINGRRVSHAVDSEIKTKAELEARRKELLAELRADHPDWDEKQKRDNLAVCFRYQDDCLRNPDPRLMPKPLCECGNIAASDNSGNITCSCGKSWYNELYDNKRFNENKKKA